MCKMYYLVLVYFFVVTAADEKINQERFLKIERLLNEQKDEIERLTNEGEELKRTLDIQGMEMMHLKKAMGNVMDENKHLKKLLNSESKTRLVDGTDKLIRPKERDIFNHKERRLLVNSGDHGDRVAFYAFMSNNEAILKHHTLTFDETKVNYGSGYNNNTGTFRAPVSGVYVITTTIHPYENSAASIDIIVNSNVHGSIFTDSSVGWATNASTGIVIAWMNQGDVSFVRTSASYNSYGSLYSGTILRCSFAGWKISD